MNDLFLTNIAQQALNLITVLTTETGDFHRVIIHQPSSYLYALVIVAGHHIAAEKTAGDTLNADR